MTKWVHVPSFIEIHHDLFKLSCRNPIWSSCYLTYLCWPNFTHYLTRPRSWPNEAHVSSFVKIHSDLFELSRRNQIVYARRTDPQTDGRPGGRMLDDASHKLGWLSTSRGKTLLSRLMGMGVGVFTSLANLCRGIYSPPCMKPCCSSSIPNVALENRLKFNSDGC